ncbi:MAG TPA: hypothetical protein VN682_10465 [Terriglobales bacterium]|jgi:hypothetical protein|nr:hypothetical protein [Terriglobales bacterium]
MTFAYTLVFISVLGLLALLLLAKGYWFARNTQLPSTSELLPIDVDAFRNLIDENEELYLRERLPGGEFRRVQRERMLAAVEYVRAAYANAGILVRIAEAARESADPKTAEAAGKLFDNAVQLRWYAVQVIPRLYFKMLFPGTSRAPRNLFDRYDILTHQALVLGRLGSVER